VPVSGCKCDAFLTAGFAVHSADLNLLATLAVLLKTRSVTLTARKLGVSQPSVSRALSQLRGLLDDPILVRSGNRMVRTQRGDELVDRVGEWVAEASTLLAQPAFHPAQVERRFRIASTDFGVLSVIGPALSAILRDAPGIAIDVVPLSNEPSGQLAAGEVDLVVSGLDHDPSLLHGRLLFLDELACVMRPTHVLARCDGDHIPLDGFLASSHVGLVIGDSEHDRVTAMLGDVGAARRIVVSLPYFCAAAEMLAQGDLIMTMPRRAATQFARRYGLTTRRAPAQVGNLEYRLLWHERSHRDPASAWLRDRLAEASHSPAE
jgi:DNA-binding transcriptional LysR family regulator